MCRTLVSMFTLLLLAGGCAEPAQYSLMLDMSQSNLANVESPDGKALIEMTLEAAGEGGLDVYAYGEETLYLPIDDTRISADDLLREVFAQREKQAKDKVRDGAYLAAEQRLLPPAAAARNKFGLGTDASQAFSRIATNGSNAVVVALTDGNSENLVGEGSPEGDVGSRTAQSLTALMRLKNIRLYVRGISQEYQIDHIDGHVVRRSVASRWEDLLRDLGAANLDSSPDSNRGYSLRGTMELSYDELTSGFKQGGTQ
jgi:hypothetical protein